MANSASPSLLFCSVSNPWKGGKRILTTDSSSKYRKPGLCHRRHCGNHRGSLVSRLIEGIGTKGDPKTSHGRAPLRLTLTGISCVGGERIRTSTRSNRPLRRRVSNANLRLVCPTPNQAAWKSLEKRTSSADEDFRPSESSPCLLLSFFSFFRKKY